MLHGSHNLCLGLQGCTLWTLKVILGNLQDSETKEDTDLLQFIANALNEYFTHKKSRIPCSFFVKIFQRHDMVGRSSIGQLVEKCGSARTEVLKGKAMELLSGILKPVLSVKGKKSGEEIDEVRQPIARTLESHLEPLSATLLSIVQKPPHKAPHKLDALQFLSSCINALIVLYPQKPLSIILDTKALLNGLKTIETAGKQKLQNLITKIEGLITRDAARILVANEKVGDMKSKTPGAKKKKSVDAEKVIEMGIKPTPSKKKKKSADVEKVIELQFGTDTAPTPSKKKRVSVDVEKVVEVETEPTPSKTKKESVDEEVVVEAEIAQSEQTPFKKKQHKERMSPKTQVTTSKKTKRQREDQ